MAQNNGISPAAQRGNGELLSEMIRKGGAMSESQAMDYFVRLLDALQFVHTNDKLHLNIAPSNVVIDSNGTIGLINSGKSGDSFNPGYAPLEVMTANTAAQGPWSDIYGAGATLYNMLTGKQPPETDDIISASNNAFDFTGVSGLMQQLICKMMSPSRKQRPQSVSDVWQLISNLAEDEQPSSVPQAPAIVPNMPQSTPAKPQPAPAMPDVPEPAPAPQPIPVNPAPRQQSQSPSYYAPPVDDEEKKSGSRTGLYILGGVLIIAAIAGAAVMLWPKSGKTADKIESASVVSLNSKTDNSASTTNTDTALNTDTEVNEKSVNDEGDVSSNDESQQFDAAAKEAQAREAEQKRKAEEEKRLKAEAEKKQKAEQNKQPPTTNKVFDVAPVMPSFPGGDNKMREFINSRKHNPTGETGSVIVQFVVNKNGSLSNFNVIKSMSPQHDQEALRVCKSLPKFNPGRDENGNPVNVKYTLPVRF